MIRLVFCILVLLLTSCLNSGGKSSLNTSPSSNSEQNQAEATPAFDCTDKENYVPFAGGDGSAADPYKICSVEQFNVIGDDVQYTDKHFELAQDLDFSGETITLVGDDTTGFAGVFDGKNNTISNFSLDNGTTAYTGLFRRTASTSTIKNLKVLNATVSGGNYTGIMIGHAGGNVDNCHTSGTVTSANTRIGGLAGRFWSEDSNIVFKNFSSSANVTGTGFTGGLMGWARGTVKDSYATGNVEGTVRVGGLVGVVDNGTLERTYATGNVTSNAADIYIAGLAGAIGGNLIDSYATGNVIAPNATDYVGGVAGAVIRGNVNGCYSSGTVNAPNAEWSGGAIGVFGLTTGSGKLQRCYSTSTITVSNYAGGVVGLVYANYTAEDSYFTGTIAAGDYVGGIVGVQYGQTKNSYVASTSITATTANIGAIDGWAAAAAENSFWDSDIGLAGGSTTAVMQSSGTYSAWDTNIWNISDGSYPTLK